MVDLTMSDIQRMVGNLYIENQVLRAQVAQLTTEVGSLKTTNVEPVDDR